MRGKHRWEACRLLPLPSCLSPQPCAITACGFLDCQHCRNSPGTKPAYPPVMVSHSHNFWSYCFSLFLATIFSLLPLQGQAQQSTAPPSSLPTTPLSSNSNPEDSLSSCELCRSVEGRPGSDLKLHRRYRDKGLHPHKKAKGLSKSSKRSLWSQLPHHKLEQEEHR